MYDYEEWKQNAYFFLYNMFSSAIEKYLKLFIHWSVFTYCTIYLTIRKLAVHWLTLTESILYFRQTSGVP